MNILLTNDDGIYSNGLVALYKKFKKKHTATVVAPEREQSAVGHGITLHKPLRISKVPIFDKCFGYAVNGTPADCVKLGIMEVLDSKPDIVVSGINPGANVGINLNYSGTVAAAREAALYEIPSIAVSISYYNVKNKKIYDDAALFIEKLCNKILKNPLPSKTFLNVNFPDKLLNEIAGVRISRQGLFPVENSFEHRSDPKNISYYWQTHQLLIINNMPNIDQSDIYNNYISITPIKCDATDYNLIEDLKKWNL